MSEISPLTDSGKRQQTARSATHERVRKVAHTTYPEMQSATRFPIKLPVSVKSSSGQSYCETQNVSANGVFFQMESEIPLGSTVNFTIQLPASVLGTEGDVQVACRGRVVRSADAGHGKGVGVVIDEYRFERR